MKLKLNNDDATTHFFEHFFEHARLLGILVCMPTSNWA